MFPRKKYRTKTPSGFTYPEMAFLLLVLALFLAGTVWVSSGAITKSHPFGKSESVGKEGERAMDRIESLVGSGRVFYYPADAAKPAPLEYVSQSLDLLADLDGDPATGLYRVNGSKGFERVVIARKGSSLYASVYSAPGASPQRVVLTGDLAPGDVSPFKVTLYGEKASNSASLLVNRVRVRLITALKGSRLVVARTIQAEAKPDLEPAP